MTVKLLLLKSGEDIIADVSEMAIGEDGSIDSPKRVVGYYLTEPCVVKIRDSQVIKGDEDKSAQQSSLRISLIKWVPLSDDKTIPVPADWVVTIVEPKEKLKEMYVEEVVNYGQDNQNTGIDESTTSD
tara:strand:- start:343 stop:726 length:384 start_codon:yes stop_codon:yes gene_type:complete